MTAEDVASYCGFLPGGPELALVGTPATGIRDVAAALLDRLGLFELPPSASVARGADAVALPTLMDVRGGLGVCGAQRGCHSLPRPPLPSPATVIQRRGLELGSRWRAPLYVPSPRVSPDEPLRGPATHDPLPLRCPCAAQPPPLLGCRGGRNRRPKSKSRRQSKNQIQHRTHQGSAEEAAL